MEGYTMYHNTVSGYFIVGNLERPPRGGSAWVGLEGWGRVSGQTVGNREQVTKNQHCKVKEVWTTWPVWGRMKGGGGRWSGSWYVIWWEKKPVRISFETYLCIHVLYILNKIYVWWKKNVQMAQKKCRVKAPTDLSPPLNPLRWLHSSWLAASCVSSKYFLRISKHIHVYTFFISNKWIRVIYTVLELAFLS